MKPVDTSKTLRENALAQVEVLFLGNSIRATVLSGEMSGRDVRVTVRGRSDATTTAIQKLIDAGLDDGGYIELKLVQKVSDAELSAHRLDLVAPSSYEDTIVASGFLGTLPARPRNKDDDWLCTFIDLRQRKTPETLSEAREIAVEEYLSLGMGVGRPGFILRASHPDVGTIAAQCTPSGFTIGNARASESVYDRFMDLGEKFFEIAKNMKERGGSKSTLELLPTVTLPIDRDYESRFMAESVNHQFIQNNLPCFTSVIAGFRRSKKGVWRCFHFSPRYMNATLLPIDYPHEISAEALDL